MSPKFMTIKSNACAPRATIATRTDQPQTTQRGGQFVWWPRNRTESRGQHCPPTRMLYTADSGDVVEISKNHQPPRLECWHGRCSSGALRYHQFDPVIPVQRRGRSRSEMEGTMTLKRTCSVVTVCVAVSLASGCVGRYKSDFPVVVENRTANTIQALANGSAVGQVAAGQTGSFSLQLPESNNNVFTNGAAP